MSHDVHYYQRISKFKVFTLFLIVIFLGAVVQAKVTEAGTEESDFKKYSNTEFGFEIQYPSSWTEERLDFDPNVNTYVVEFDSPPEGAEDRYTDFLNIQIRPFEGSTIHADLESGQETNQTTTDNLAALGEYLTLSAYADDLKEVYRNTYDNFQNLSFDFVKLGDRHAYSLVQTHTLQLPDGEIDLKVLETMTIVGDKVYSLQYTAENDKYAKYMPLAQEMIKSFKFISPQANLNDQEPPSAEVSTSSSNSTSTISGFKIYKDTNHGIEVQIPSIWEIDENDPTPNDSLAEIAYFLTPLTGDSDGYHEIVGILAEELSSAPNTTDYLDYSIDAYSQAQDNFEVISSDTNAEFAGRPGYNLIYTSTLKDENNDEDNDLKLKTMEIGTIIGNKSYYLSYTAQSENYEKYLPQVQQIVDSFKVLADNSSTSIDASGSSTTNENITPVNGDLVKVSILAGSTVPNAKGYSPELINIRVGDIVRWSNDDGSCHTVTSGVPGDQSAGEIFDSSLMEGTEEGTCTIDGKRCDDCPRIFERRFEVAGEFPYHDTIYPYIQGTVIVTEAESSATAINTDEVPEGNQSNTPPIASEDSSFLDTRKSNETKSDFLTFLSDKEGVSIQYPSDWTPEALSNLTEDEEIVPIVLISPPISSETNANTFLELGYDSSVQGNDFSLDEYVHGVIEVQQTDSDISDLKVDSVKTDITIANMPGYSLVSSRNADGISMKSLEVGTLVGDKLYYVLFETEESKYNTLIPEVQKMIDSLRITGDGEVNKKISAVENNFENVTNPTSGTITFKLVSNPTYQEVSSTDVKICPTNNCEFYLSSNFNPTSDGSGYTLNGKLYVTSGATVEYDIHSDLKEVASGKEDVNTTQTLKGTMSLTNSDNSSTQAMTKYEMEGILERVSDKDMDIQLKESEGLQVNEKGSETLFLIAKEIS